MEGLCPLCQQRCQNIGTHFRFNHDLTFRDWLLATPRLCEGCGELISPPKSKVAADYVLKRRFCSIACRGRHFSGNNHPRYKGGWIAEGYRILRIGGQAIREHRLVMEQILGRKLGRRELVHHVNGDRLDNRPENLVVVSPAEHTLIHKMHEGNTAESRRRQLATRRARHGY